MQIIIDADPIVYRAGFAGQATQYFVVYSYEGDDNIYQESFCRTEKKTSNKLYKEWKEEQVGLEILEEWTEIVPEPLENVLATVKHILRDCLHETAKHFNIDVFDETTRILLSGPGNFRNDIATVREYKGNRKEDHKPHWYQQIRNYLTEQWDAEVIEGREADDECAILTYQGDGNSIICTIDKDLDQVPGHHYDYVKKIFYHTEVDEGHALFYKQVLSGDSTDNIPGAYKIGAVRAATIIDNLVLEHGMDHDRIWGRIVEEYQGTLDKYGEKCEYFDLAEREGVEAVAIEMARLVKMQEYVGQLWTPVGREDEQLEIGHDE
jgi:hypothetical protein